MKECIEEVIKRLERLMLAINEELKQHANNDDSIGDWVSQKAIMTRTGLGKTKLYELRRDNKVSSSTITGKGIFYRLSDFENLLNYNENK